MLVCPLMGMPDTTLADVLAVGGGPAGSATATMLARRCPNARIVLIDRAHFPRAKPCAEYISPGAVEILRSLAVPPGLLSSSGRALDGMEIHAPGGATFRVRYRDPRTDADRQSLAMDRLHLDSALLANAAANGVDVHEGFRATSVLVDGGVTIGVSGVDAAGQAHRILAPLVIGADGRHSLLVRDLHLTEATRWPPRFGLVAHLRGVPWPEPYGQMLVGRGVYVGVAPLTADPENLVSVGLVTAMPTPGRLRGTPEERLRGLLQRNFPSLASRLASGVLARPIQGAGPLGHSVRRVAGSGYLMVGDAAGFFDPFTGEGIYRALRGAQLTAATAERILAERPVTALAWSRIAASYVQERYRVFHAKETLTRIIQLFVRIPPLMDYAIARLQQRPAAAACLGNVLGDLEPASSVLRPQVLWELLGL